jgi:hypothetical protein
MNIRIQINPNGWFFSQLDRSRVFMYDNGTMNVVAMKIKPITNGEIVYNAVELKTGFAVFVKNDTPIIPLWGEYVVYNDNAEEDEKDG